MFLDIDRFQADGRGSFRAWVIRIARHNLVDAIRELTALKRGGNGSAGGARGVNRNGHLVEHLLAKGTTPSEAARRCELNGILDRALDQLPDAYREVVRLYDLQRCSVAETAEQLGCMPGAVFMRRSRAHRMLKETLGRFSDYL